MGILLAFARSLLGVLKALLLSADMFISHTMIVVSRAQAFSALQPTTSRSLLLKEILSSGVLFSDNLTLNRALQL